MFNTDTWQEIWHTIKRNKVRSLLTAFGVFWGIFMLIMLVGIGEGFERGMMKMLGEFNPNSAILGTNRTTVPYKGFRTNRYWSLRSDDLDLIKNKVDGVLTCFPNIQQWGGEGSVVYKRGKGAFNTLGTSPAQMLVNPVDIIEGRYLNDLDVKGRRKVCVIGPESYQEFFADGSSPVGEMITIQGVNYTIVGRFEVLAKGINFGGPAERDIHVPYNVLQSARNMGDRLQMMGLVAKDGQRIDGIMEDVKTLLKQKYSIAPNDDLALWSFNMQEQMDMISGMALAIKTLIWLVGLSSLLAGLIGVSNIMMISIKERTMEIGIRRAIGAKPRQIILQIINESAIITFASGLAGLMLGIACLLAIEKIMANMGDSDIPFDIKSIDFGTAMGALVVIAIGGLLAGLLPANRAMKIKAIDALRDE